MNQMETVFVVFDKDRTFCGVYKTRRAAELEIEAREKDEGGWFDEFMPHVIEEEEVIHE